MTAVKRLPALWVLCVSAAFGQGRVEKVELPPNYAVDAEVWPSVCNGLLYCGLTDTSTGVTDLFAYDGREFTNIAVPGDLGLGSEPLHGYGDELFVAVRRREGGAIYYDLNIYDGIGFSEVRFDDTALSPIVSTNYANYDGTAVFSVTQQAQNGGNYRLIAYDGAGMSLIPESPDIRLIYPRTHLEVYGGALYMVGQQFVTNGSTNRLISYDGDFFYFTDDASAHGYILEPSPLEVHDSMLFSIWEVSYESALYAYDGDTHRRIALPKGYGLEDDPYHDMQSVGGKLYLVLRNNSTNEYVLSTYDDGAFESLPTPAGFNPLSDHNTQRVPWTVYKCDIYLLYGDEYEPALARIEASCDMQSSIDIDQSGNVDLTVNGGTAPYSYAWSTGDTTQDITLPAQPPDTLTVMVTDNNGCTVADTAQVQSAVVSRPSMGSRRIALERREGMLRITGLPAIPGAELTIHTLAGRTVHAERLPDGARSVTVPLPCRVGTLLIVDIRAGGRSRRRAITRVR